MPEEEAFAVVVKLMQEYRLREIFKPSMAELGLVLYQLKHLVEVSSTFICRAARNDAHVLHSDRN